jgi:hypothetical protein
MKRGIKFKYVVKKRDGDIITYILTLTEIQKRIGEWLVFNSVLDEIGLENYEIIDILQFTGLKDKNGKDIYEGDIICIVFNESKTYHVIRFDKCCFEAFPMMSYANTLRRFNDECVIVGNEYENPELIANP